MRDKEIAGANVGIRCGWVNAFTMRTLKDFVEPVEKLGVKEGKMEKFGFDRLRIRAVPTWAVTLKPASYPTATLTVT